MKQGLSLRVSQHLALTPQLQQSIRLLQLSTLELGQEVDQMLDDNPFLERSLEEAERESFGLAQADTLVSAADKDAESAAYSGADFPEAIRTKSENDTEDPLQGGNDDPSWEGDGSVSLAPDDSEWGGEARAHGNNLTGDDEMDATELARNQESLQSYLHRQALSLRLSPEDGAALRFLIESLNDDGYLEDELVDLARGLAGPDSDQLDDLVHHFTVARSLLQSLEPVGVGACNLAQCLSLQLRALQSGRLADDAADPQIVAVALRICAQPMELLARRDIKHLVSLCTAPDAQVRLAIALIGRLEPKPGRRFVDVERNIVVPDVIGQHDLESALTELRRKRGDLPEFTGLRLERFAEGKCAQVMHVGPYATEPATLAGLPAFLAEHGLVDLVGPAGGRHHEIYLGDPRRAAPEKLRTILRHPVAAI